MNPTFRITNFYNVLLAHGWHAALGPQLMSAVKDHQPKGYTKNTLKSWARNAEVQRAMAGELVGPLYRALRVSVAVQLLLCFGAGLNGGHSQHK